MIKSTIKASIIEAGNGLPYLGDLVYSGETNTVYKIDSKTLQLRWTDIEIRRYVIPKMQQESS